MKYDVLKNTNLSENGFHLSLTRGEVRDDLDGRFTAPYLKWHCDEKFLSVHSSEDEEKGWKAPEFVYRDDDELDKAIAEDDAELDKSLAEDEEDDGEDFPDFDSMNYAEVKS